jgi:hypothetical protein
MRLAWLGIWLAAALMPRLAWAHPTPGSVVFIDFGVDAARLEHDAPVEELRRALQAPLLDEGTPDIVVRHGDLLRRYAAEHLHASAEDGRPWRVDVRALESRESADGPRVKFLFELAAPEGAGSSTVHLYDDIVLHEVVTHYTTIYVRRDWASGITSDEPRLAGALHAWTKDIVLVRAGTFWQGVRGVLRLGMEHIASGTDHLLFLFMLVIATPMVAGRGRWVERRELSASLGAIVRVVTAFTIGHSVTLSLAALGMVVAPSAVVESAVALSIFATAVHALRPWFPAREAWLAGAFGLVHGLAFASTLAGSGINGRELARTLLGFNLGIELAQLIALALVVPWVLLLAATPAFAGFRFIVAMAGALLSATWFAERAFGMTTPVAEWLGVLERHPLACLAALAAVAIAASVLHRSTPLAARAPGARAASPSVACKQSGCRPAH